MSDWDDSVFNIVGLSLWDGLEVACVVDDGVKNAPKDKEDEREDDLAVGIDSESVINVINVKRR